VDEDADAGWVLRFVAWDGGGVVSDDRGEFGGVGSRVRLEDQVGSVAISWTRQPLSVYRVSTMLEWTAYLQFHSTRLRQTHRPPYAHG